MLNLKYIIVGITMIFLVLFGCLEQKNTTPDQSILSNIQDLTIPKPAEEVEEINQTSKIINISQEFDQTNKITQEQQQEIQNQNIEMEILNETQIPQELDYLEQKYFEPKIDIFVEAYPFVISRSTKDCKISISPNILEPYQEVKTEVYINAYYSEAFYDCGNQKKFAGRNGLFRQMSFCKFLDKGIFKQSTYIDDKECAYTYAIVVSAAHKNEKICNVVEQAREDLEDFYKYKLRLFLYNFGQDEKLLLQCNNKTKEISIKELFPTVSYGMIDALCIADMTINNFNAKVENKECN